MLSDNSCARFTELLNSKEPVPGGGGASALAGALAASLGGMVGYLTTGKKKYADVEEDIRRLMAEAEELRMQLLNAIDEDANAFEPLSKAYGLPKDTPGRDELMEECLKKAAGAPLHILELCAETMEMLKELSEKGSKLAISDAATGAALCKGAMLGASINVKVNTALMKDRTYADDIDSKVKKITERYSLMADDIYNSVFNRL